MKLCATCDTPITQDYQGHREKVYCSDRCKQKAYRDRHAIVIRLEAFDTAYQAIVKSLEAQLQWAQEDRDYWQGRYEATASGLDLAHERIERLEVQVQELEALQDVSLARYVAALRKRGHTDADIQTFRTLWKAASG